MEKERYFATRHARPERNKSESDPASEEYPDITVEGVEQAREKARGEILDLINDSPEGSVLFIGATSDQPRTKQTAEIYGDALAEYSREADSDDILVVTKSEIEEMSDEDGSKGYKKRVEKLQKLIDANPDKKIVLDYPLMVKQLAYKYDDRWTDKQGNKTEYFTEILKKHGGSHDEAGKDWIANNGELILEDGRILNGPLPEKVAQDYLEGINRVKDFVKKHVSDRPVIIGNVGHQWDIDALVTYLSRGKVDDKLFQEVTGGEIARETEMTSFEIDEGVVTLKYRGNEFESPEI